MRLSATVPKRFEPVHDLLSEYRKTLAYKTDF